MKISDELEDVFSKTDYWLKKGEHIENIHLQEISILVSKGEADYGEKHVQNQKA